MCKCRSTTLKRTCICVIFTADQQGIPSEIDVFSFTPSDSDEEETKIPFMYELPAQTKTKQHPAYQNVDHAKKTVKRRSKIEELYDLGDYPETKHQRPDDQEPLYETVETLPISSRRPIKQFLEAKVKPMRPPRKQISNQLKLTKGESKMADDSSLTESDTHNHSQVSLCIYNKHYIIMLCLSTVRHLWHNNNWHPWEIG